MNNVIENMKKSMNNKDARFQFLAGIVGIICIVLLLFGVVPMGVWGLQTALTLMIPYISKFLPQHKEGV